MNFLLVGNSRLHWAKYSKNQSKFFHTKKEQKFPENIDLDQLIIIMYSTFLFNPPKSCISAFCFDTIGIA